MDLEKFTRTVMLRDGSRLSYLHTASRQQGDIVHQKDRQTLVGYEQVLAGRSDPGRVLEIGIYSGGSLAMWRELWPAAEILGLDITLAHINPEAAAHLDRVGVHRQVLPMPNPSARGLGEFDLIIDDGAHGASSVIDSFAICWSMLRPGGVYIVEDWHLAMFDPVKIAGTLGQAVIGTDHGEHFCDGPFPENAAERVDVRRRLIAVYKRS
jgi:SAM-dependent methyltransferase